MNLPNDSQGKVKGFWERPEGTTGMIFSAGMVFAGGYLLYTFLPFVIILLSNTLTTLFLLAAIGAFIMIVTNKKVRLLVSYLFKSAMRAITSIFVTIDPIGILKSYAEELQDKINNIDNNLDKLFAQIQKLKESIESNEKDKNNLITKAGILKDKNRPEDFNILKSIANQIERLNKFNMDLIPLYDKMRMLHEHLIRIKQIADTARVDIINEIDIRIRKKKLIDPSYNVIKSAKALLNGSEGKELYDEAMELLADEYGKKVGEITRFLNDSDSIIRMADLDEEANVEELMKKLNNIDSNKVLEHISAPVGSLPFNPSGDIKAAEYVIVETNNKNQSKYL